MSTSPRRPTRRLRHPVSLLLLANAVALVLVAVWFRLRLLGTVPGINGDEAWYGVKALELLRGEGFPWETPTGNPPNPFFFGPVVLLHVLFAPSFALLRIVAVVSGLVALAVNWGLCRWVLDRRTAAVSTVLLAILPINIAYSRFAWDASQSVLGTLPVLYLALAAVRFPAHRTGHLLMAIAALVAAVLIHPTNLFAAAAIVAAAATPEVWQDLKQATAKCLCSRRTVVGLVVAGILLTAAVAHWFRGGGPSIAAERLVGVQQLQSPGWLQAVSTLYPRLFTGATTYRYLAGSRSWAEWPAAEGTDGWGLDVLLFWAVLATAIAGVVQSWRVSRQSVDRALLVAWTLWLLGFLLAAGPSGMVPGYERYALSLIAPTVVLIGRGLTIVAAGVRSRRWAILAIASLVGWLLLADYHAHYFRFIERTGGQAHPTFRAGPAEPKQAAMQWILDESRDQASGNSSAIWIVTSQWWNRWPLEYLAKAEPEIQVVAPSQLESNAQLRAALDLGRVWWVEFDESDELGEAKSKLSGRLVREHYVNDCAGRPVLCVLHVP